MTAPSLGTTSLPADPSGRDLVLVDDRDPLGLDLAYHGDADSARDATAAAYRDLDLADQDRDTAVAERDAAIASRDAQHADAPGLVGPTPASDRDVTGATGAADVARDTADDAHERYVDLAQRDYLDALAHVDDGPYSTGAELDAAEAAAAADRSDIGPAAPTGREVDAAWDRHIDGTAIDSYGDATRLADESRTAAATWADLARDADTARSGVDADTASRVSDLYDRSAAAWDDRAAAHADIGRDR